MVLSWRYRPGEPGHTAPCDIVEARIATWRDNAPADQAFVVERKPAKNPGIASRWMLTLERLRNAVVAPHSKPRPDLASEQPEYQSATCAARVERIDFERPVGLWECRGNLVCIDDDVLAVSDFVALGLPSFGASFRR